MVLLIYITMIKNICIIYNFIEGISLFECFETLIL